MSRRVLEFLKRFGPALVVVAAITAALVTGAVRHISVGELRERRAMLLGFNQAHPILSILAYIGADTAVTALALPATVPVTLAGGLLFGAWIGGLAGAAGCTLGSAILFLACRTAAGDVIRRIAGPRIAQIEDGVRRDAFFYILTLRLIPVMPFGLATVALGFLEIPLGEFVPATFLGILPLSLIYANFGAGLRAAFASHKHLNFHSFLEIRLVLSLIALGLLALVPVAIRYLQRRLRA